MNKEELIRTLAARAADAVVLLEKIWPDNDAFLQSSAIVSTRAITSSRTAVL